MLYGVGVSLLFAATRKVVMTVHERRPKVQREPRRLMNGRAAWLTLDGGATRQECSVLYVAPGGAKIAVDTDFDVGDTFELALVASHEKRQRCEIVWRRESTFGVKFL
jgi:hypothetical protein